MAHTLERQNHTKCLIEHNTLIVNGLLITNTYENKRASMYPKSSVKYNIFNDCEFRKQ